MEQLSNKQIFWLVSLRVFIGWHFLYEGIVKLTNPNWSSFGYLMDSSGFLQSVFHTIAGNPNILSVIDFINIWGLMAVGFGLILGFLCKPAIWSGIILLGLYYLSHPPFTGLQYAIPSEGNYLIVNKVLIELAAMVILLLFPTSRLIGLDRIILNKSKQDVRK